MEAQEYVMLPEYFKEHVHKKYMDHNGDPGLSLYFVDEFLNKYPFYPEALLFKARMLIALHREQEALSVLESCDEVNKFGVVCTYDKAEVKFRLGDKIEALKLIQYQIEVSLRDILEGLENFLLGIDFDMEEMNSIRDLIKKEIVKCLSNNINFLDFNCINQRLSAHQVITE